MSAETDTIDRKSARESKSVPDTMGLLPAGFEALEPFVEDWVLLDSRARSAKRQAIPYEEIKRFYDAVLPYAQSALDRLSMQPLGSMEADDQRLLGLMLSLAEISTAVEWYQQPQVIDGFAMDRFTLTEQLPDLDRQG